MDRKEAKEVLKLCVQRMDWYSVKRMAEAVKALGADAGSELWDLGVWKHELAQQRGDAYIPPSPRNTK